ncbi:MAG: Hsp33 family molecular chaperone HslO [Firmicutes bacterium]|nr:Hsp33 family molecular chaperone HslO [Bacillota bacterium]
MDKIVKALIFDDAVSVCVIKSTSIVNKAIRLFALSPVAAAALGRTLTIAAYMAGELKNKNDSLTITIDGGGKIGKIVVSCDSFLNVRGYVSNPQINLNLSCKKLDVGGAVGNRGKLTVVRDTGKKEPYIGSVSLVSGEIADDFTKYYFESEQTPIAISLGVLIEKNQKCLSAGGLIIKPLPNCSGLVIDKLEKLIGNFTDLSAQLKNIEAKEFLTKNFSEYSLNFLDEKIPKYKCKCNINKVKNLLYTIPKNEIFEMLQKDKKIEIICHFCNKSYLFKREDFKF